MRFTTYDNLTMRTRSREDVEEMRPFKRESRLTLDPEGVKLKTHKFTIENLAGKVMFYSDPVSPTDTLLMLPTTIKLNRE